MSINSKKLLAVLFTTLVFTGWTYCAPSVQAKSYGKIYNAKISRNYSVVQNLIRRKNYKAAKQKCLDILKKRPNDQRARLYLGEVYSEQYKLDAAKREFKRILSRNPNNAAALNGLGEVYYKRTSSSDMEVRRNLDKYYQKAFKHFKKAIEIAPAYYTAYYNVAKVFLQLKSYEESEYYFEKALELEPGSSKALDGLGQVDMAYGRTDEAINKFRRAIAKNSKNSTAHYHLGEALIKKDKYSEAIKSLNTSLYLFKNSAPVHNMLGRAYELQGNEMAAITQYNKAALIKPEDTDAYMNLSNIYQRRGDGELAISQLKNLIKLMPDFTEGKLKVAELSLKNNKLDQAIYYYNEALQSPKYTAVALNGLSDAYFKKAQNAKAYNSLSTDIDYTNVENLIKRAITYTPDNLQLYLALLKISRLNNNDTQAGSYLNKIITDSSYQPVSNVIKGEAHLSFKNYKKAQQHFDIAVNQISNTDDLLKISEILISNRAYPSARLACQKILNRDPDNALALRYLDKLRSNEHKATLQYNKGKAFYDEGQKIASIDTLRQSLDLNPYNLDAQLLIAKAYEKKRYYFNALEHYNAYLDLSTYGNYQQDNKYVRKVNRLKKKIKKAQQKNKKIKKYTEL